MIDERVRATGNRGTRAWMSGHYLEYAAWALSAVFARADARRHGQHRHDLRQRTARPHPREGELELTPRTSRAVGGT